MDSFINEGYLDSKLLKVEEICKQKDNFKHLDKQHYPGSFINEGYLDSHCPHSVLINVSFVS
jgi:hypothetical protein